MTRVLLVEDDPGISEPLARALRREGYDVDVREDGRAALDGRTMPVLILTARADEVDTVVGLDAGADDYVTKPFRLAELLARVRALLRRTPDGNPVSDTEDLRIDPEGRRAWFQGEELQLTAKEFDLLRVLLREQGRVVTREQLMKETAAAERLKGLVRAAGVAGDVCDQLLKAYRKLGDDVAQPRHISTVRGLGFRFERPESASEPS